MCFTLIALEMSGALGPFSLTLSHSVSAATGDTRSHNFQRLSVAVQRGNAASNLGTLISSPSSDF